MDPYTGTEVEGLRPRIKSNPFSMFIKTRTKTTLPHRLPNSTRKEEGRWQAGLGSAPLLTVAAPQPPLATYRGFRHKATGISGPGPQRRLRTALSLRAASEAHRAESRQAPPGAEGSGGHAPGGQRAEDSPWTPSF